MAQQNRREIELALEITTANADAIEKLRQDVLELAKSGGDAAPQFKQLADRLKELETQARGLEELEALRQTLEQSKAAYTDASDRLRRYKDELARLQDATDAAKATQASLAVEYRKANADVQDAAAKIRELKRSTEDHTAANVEYKARLNELQAEEERARQVKRALGVELERAKAATREASQAQAALGREFQAARPELERTIRSYETAQREADKLSADLQKAGLATDKFGNAQAELVRAVNDVRTSVAAQVVTLAEKERAEREAAEAAERAAIEAQRRAAIEKQAAADYVNFWVRALNEREAAEREAAQASEAASRRMREAFSDVGVASVRDLRAQIDRVKESLSLLAASGQLTGAELDQAMRKGQARINELEREIREATGSLTLMDRAAGLLNTTIGKLAVFVSLTEVVQRTAAAFIDASKQIETLRLGLNTIYRDAGVTAQQIDLLRKAASASGIAIGDISNAFVKFSASAQASNIPLEQTNALFEALTRAAGTLGLSGAKVESALEALSQMAAKGVVNMEELRQQLGDALPGALALTAKGLGITQQELFKLVESGGLTARDLFPSLTKALQEVGGEVNTLNAAWARLRNAITIGFQALGDTGALDLLKSALMGVTEAVKTVMVAFTGLVEGFFLVGRSAGVAVAALTGGEGFSGALAAAAAEADVTNERMRRLVETMDGSTNSASAAKTSVDALGLSVETVGAAFVQFGVGAAKANEILREQTALAEKAAAAIEIEGQTRVATAQITGNQTAVLLANAEAAQANAEARAKVAEALTHEANAMRVQIEAAEMMAAVSAEEQAARADYINKLREQLALKEADAAKSREQADAARVAAEAAKVQAQAAADNSARQKELLEVYVNAKAMLDVLVQAEKDGIATRQEVQRQAEATAAAEALYRDAVKDSIAATEAKRNLEQASLSLKELTIRALIAEQQTIRDVAKARGEDYAAQQASNEIKRLEIELLRLSAEAKQADARAMIANAEATRAAGIATGSWNAAQEMAYQASLKKAAALEKEAQIALETAKRLEMLAETTRSAGAAAESASGKYDRLAGSLQKVAQSAERASKAVEDAGSSATNAASSSTSRSYSMNAWQQLELKMAAGTLTVDDLGLAKTAYETAYANQLFGWRGADAMARKYKQVYEDLLKKKEEQGSKYRVSVPAPTSTTSTATPVTIVINGSTTRVNVASQSDAAALENLLRQLSQQSSRATI